MKKKIGFILGGIFIMVALGAMLLFAFSGKDEPHENPAVTLDGSWKVVAYTQAGNVSLPDQEFFVFTSDIAKAYRNNEAEPFATSGYELTPSSYPKWELELSDISRKYTVDVITDNYIRLYESSSIYMDLIRYANNDLNDLDYEESVVVGNWNVAYRNTSDTITEERLVFADGILNDYRNGGTDPVASVPYYWNEARCICVDALNVQMRCYPYSTDVLFFVEVGTGLVWELHAAE